MSARAEYWRGIELLRQAEHVADLGTVGGSSTDQPPEPGRESEWIAEWTDRAQRAFDRAVEIGRGATPTLRERAGRIAERVRRAIDAINRANPTNPQSWPKLWKLRDDAAKLERLYLVAAGAGTLLLMFGVYWWLTKGR